VSNCDRCTAPSGGLYLCGTCLLALKIDLADVAGILPTATINGTGHTRNETQPSLPDELRTSLTRQDQLTDPRDHTRTGGETPLIFRNHVGEAVWILHQVLAVWVQELGHDPREQSPRDLALWYLDHLDLIRKTPTAEQLVDEVTDAIHQARRAIDRPDDRRIYLGHCGHQTCREELYGLPWLDTATCKECDTEYKISERHEWLRQRAAQHPGTVPEVTGFLRMTGVQCTTDMVYGYVKRGRITPVWANNQRRALYLISDVLTAIRDRYVRRGTT
jgi:hypothetical protein